VSTQLSKEVILHIGTSKTGTTSIQAALAQNQTLLAKNKILYPNLTGSGFGQYLERGLLTGNADPDWELYSWQSASGIERIAFLIDSGISANLDIEMCVLSGERTSVYAQNEEFWELLALKSRSWDARFNVVVYLRHPFSYFVTCYKQQVKQGHFWGTLDQFIDRFLNDVNFATTFAFYKSIPKVINMAREHDIELTFFQYEAHSKNLVQHFFTKVMHIDPQFISLDTRRFNLSINMWEVEFHRGVGSVSPKMAFSLGLERTDLHLSQFRKHINGSNEIALSELGVSTLEKEFVLYKESIDGLIPFAHDVDVSLPGKLSNELGFQELLIREQIYELGRFVAMAQEYGYVNMENRKLF
jgi:hypothetical protein